MEAFHPGAFAIRWLIVDPLLSAGHHAFEIAMFRGEAIAPFVAETGPFPKMTRAAAV
ncbi:hypothetical protein [Sphingomonas sp.]|uniref:hypothetical protein n=1 Tax=Sphingomonas sp. TaxID=28214 RepID=UPI0025E867C9|nr:hypothetical protein [Sphingomonas sp.]